MEQNEQKNPVVSWFEKFGNNIQQGWSDLCAVGEQMRKSVIADGEKFWANPAAYMVNKQVENAKNIAYGFNNIAKDWEGGIKAIAESKELADKSDNPAVAFNGFWRGVGRMFSFGGVSYSQDRFNELVDVQYDVMGNVAGMSAKYEDDAFTKIWVRKNADEKALAMNAEDEVREAVAEENYKKAADISVNQDTIEGLRLQADVRDAVMTGVTIVGTVATKGALLAPLTALDVANGVDTALMREKADDKAMKFSIDNIYEDIRDILDLETELLVNTGRMPAEFVEAYKGYVADFYVIDALNASDPDFYKNNGFEDFLDYKNTIMEQDSFPTLTREEQDMVLNAKRGLDNTFAEAVTQASGQALNAVETKSGIDVATVCKASHMRNENSIETEY